MSALSSSALTKPAEGRRVVGRFAPSPTGELHAGNIFAYLIAWLVAKSHGGSIVLRIEDIDHERSRQSFADKIMHDLEMLGLTWDHGPIYQRERTAAYANAFATIANTALVYPCFCTRADIHALGAPHAGERFIYPGLCKKLDTSVRSAHLSAGKQHAWRIEVPDAIYCLNDHIQKTYQQNLVEDCGDFIIRRADGAFAYQLAVVVDDAEEGITSIVRGVDLLSSTPQQMFLQELLGYNTPNYWHIPLFVDKDGRRLSKRHSDAGLDIMLKTYRYPEAIIGHIAFLAGMIDQDSPLTPYDLCAEFKDADWSDVFTNNHAIIWQ